jgi:hypothetical protein
MVMGKVNKSRFLIGGAIALVVISALVYLSFGGTNISADAPTLVDQQEAGFRYRIGAPDSRTLRIDVDYDTRTVAGVLGYQKSVAARSARYAKDNAGRLIEVDVTFNKPLPVQQFNSFVEKYGLQPRDFVIRSIDPDGQRSTISGALTAGEGISQETIERMLLASGGTVRGVVDFRATLLGSAYPQLSADSNVFLVDALEAELKDKAATLRPNQDRAAIEYTPRSLYWFLEDLGLVQK